MIEVSLCNLSDPTCAQEEELRKDKPEFLSFKMDMSPATEQQIKVIVPINLLRRQREQQYARGGQVEGEDVVFGRNLILQMHDHADEQ